MAKGWTGDGVSRSSEAERGESHAAATPMVKKVEGRTCNNKSFGVEGVTHCPHFLAEGWGEEDRGLLAEYL